jgi:hypothetical protein
MDLLIWFVWWQSHSFCVGLILGLDFPWDTTMICLVWKWKPSLTTFYGLVAAHHCDVYVWATSSLLFRNHSCFCRVALVWEPLKFIESSFLLHMFCIAMSFLLLVGFLILFVRTSVQTMFSPFLGWCERTLVAEEDWARSWFSGWSWAWGGISGFTFPCYSWYHVRSLVGFRQGGLIIEDQNTPITMAFFWRQDWLNCHKIWLIDQKV